MQIVDSVSLVLDGSRVKRTALGYLAGTARIARGGNVQTYRGSELGRTDMETVRVYRPAEEVFAEDAMRSYANLTMTDDHPPQGLVDSENWRGLTRGHVGPRVARDGDFVDVPFILMDGATVSAVEAGKRELSMGYTSQLVWGDGVSPSGEKYDAKMTTIRGNHVAVVKTARGGSELKIGDDRREEPQMKNIVVDGITYEVSPQAAEVVTKLVKDAETARGATAALQVKLDAEVAAHGETKKKLETADAKTATLETQLKDARDPSKLADAAKEFSTLQAQAKAIVPTIKLDGLDATAIRKAVVDAKLGEKSKNYTADQYATAYDLLSSDVKVTKDALAAHLAAGAGEGGGQAYVADAAALEEMRRKSDQFHADRAAKMATRYLEQDGKDTQH